jgi:hypothetical protein
MNILRFTLPTRAERVRLHLRCLWRRPAQWRFHVAGLLRELIP